ncbi:MAG TPA: phosphoenolpyruvate carboxykinase (ATP) [Terriglobales bacterium]|nr:phosphoenolpyruvate carboxykinase (ATP) [Terriglobales bacterium]
MALATALPDLSSILSRPNVHHNLSAGNLVEHSIRRNEAMLANNGALAALTGSRTGRSPKDKFIVKDDVTESKINWGSVNQPLDPDKFEALYHRVTDYLADRELFVQDLFCGADPRYRLAARLINEYAWHNLFVKQLFVRPSAQELANYAPEFTVIAVPEFLADPQRDGTASEVFILTDFTRKVVLIGGTKYAGELKKCIFGVMNFIQPQNNNVFPMHCSANIGKDGSTALFFGLSGTGKTTLSADPDRELIGDDEHGWSQHGIFNFEGGCYAKCIRLSKEGEPQIYNAIRFGAVLENVAVDPNSRRPDYDSDRYTENTRVAYPVEFIANAAIPGVGRHPKNVVLLTADAFGVLPPISRLTPNQAMYHFISGYTSKLAGTEAGVGKEPQPNFSTCFAAPFLPLPPKAYAQMLGERLKQHNAQCWLVNTGWVGGPYGIGSRMRLSYTRAMVRALLDGRLRNAEFEIEPAFGLSIPKAVPEVPPELLNPRNLWSDKAAYDRQAAELVARFVENFKKFDVPEEVRKAGPKEK